MAEKVWVTRWLTLRDQAGLTVEQAKQVFYLMDRINAFGSNKMAASVWASLCEAYKMEGEPNGDN